MPFTKDSIFYLDPHKKRERELQSQKRKLDEWLYLVVDEKGNRNIDILEITFNNFVLKFCDEGNYFLRISEEALFAKYCSWAFHNSNNNNNENNYKANRAITRLF